MCEFRPENILRKCRINCHPNSCCFIRTFHKTLNFCDHISEVHRFPFSGKNCSFSSGCYQGESYQTIHRCNNFCIIQINQWLLFCGKFQESIFDLGISGGNRLLEALQKVKRSRKASVVIIWKKGNKTSSPVVTTIPQPEFTWIMFFFPSTGSSAAAAIRLVGIWKDFNHDEPQFCILNSNKLTCMVLLRKL